MTYSPQIQRPVTVGDFSAYAQLCPHFWGGGGWCTPCWSLPCPLAVPEEIVTHRPGQILTWTDSEPPPSQLIGSAPCLPIYFWSFLDTVSTELASFQDFGSIPCSLWGQRKFIPDSKPHAVCTVENKRFGRHHAHHCYLAEQCSGTRWGTYRFLVELCRDLWRKRALTRMWTRVREELQRVASQGVRRLSR